MKKILVLLVLLVGCSSLSNTPKRQVEAFFKNYQALDKKVINNLNDVTLEHTTLNDLQKDKYIKIMKRHYQNLTYEIKDETVNGNSAVVEVEIAVTDFKKVIDEANQYLKENQSQFYNNGLYSEEKFTDYKLENMEKTNYKVEYTLFLALTKQDDKWTLNDINTSIYDKINGVYNY